MLGELQAIKANREEKQLKTIFQRVRSALGDRTALGAGTHPPWRNILAINAGYVEQPWRVTAEGKYEMLGGTTLESIAPFWMQASMK